MCSENYIIDYQAVIRDKFFPKKTLYFGVCYLPIQPLLKMLIAFESKMQICRFKRVVF